MAGSEAELLDARGWRYTFVAEGKEVRGVGDFVGLQSQPWPPSTNCGWLPHWILQCCLPAQPLDAVPDRWLVVGGAVGRKAIGREYPVCWER